ncbi:MAG: radical SAM protein [Candidatus Lokiarchaeota archaeon]|nr:radical SAM protein [Candidatus Lokiarchaeota archaeon]
MTIEKIRISVGSASVLGLGLLPKFKNPPTTCYIMTFKEGHCIANCGFCPQARSSKSSVEKLSRVNWPIFSFKDFLTKLKYMPFSKKFERICIQTLNYPENFNELIEIVTQIKIYNDIPISVAIPPLSKEKLKELKIKGVQRVGIALDGATPEIFKMIKGKYVGGPYTWEEHFQKLNEALEIFSPGFVSTHIIIGLEETEKDVIELIEELYNLGIIISLFAFTPIKGTRLENIQQPAIKSFRKLQLGRFLIYNNEKNSKDFIFNMRGEIININISKKELKMFIYDTDAFLTSGCPGCNRPFYTSKPSGPVYNYPRPLTEKEKMDIYELLHKFVK